MYAQLGDEVAAGKAKEEAKALRLGVTGKELTEREERPEAYDMLVGFDEM